MEVIPQRKYLNGGHGMKKIVITSFMFFLLLFGGKQMSAAEIATATIPFPTSAPTQIPMTTPVFYGEFTYKNFYCNITDPVKMEICIVHISVPTGDLVIPGEINGYKVVKVGLSYEVYGGAGIYNNDRTKITSVTIGEGVKEISKELFSGCTNLKKISLPDSLLKIEESAFKDCTALTEVTIPKNVATISQEAFSACTKLKKLIFKGDSTLGQGVFWDCTSLTSISFSGVESSIDFAAFWGCDKLKVVTIPTGVNEVNYDGKNSPSVKKLIIKGSSTKLAVQNANMIANLTVVALQNSEAEKSAKQNEISYKAVTLPKTPTLNKLKTVSGKKKISWKSNSGASGYQVYYSKTKTGSYKKLTTTTKTSYTTAKKGYYKIRAFKKYESMNWYSKYTSKKVS